MASTKSFHQDPMIADPDSPPSPPTSSKTPGMETKAGKASAPVRQDSTSSTIVSRMKMFFQGSGGAGGAAGGGKGRRSKSPLEESARRYALFNSVRSGSQKQFYAFRCFGVSRSFSLIIAMGEYYCNIASYDELCLELSMALL